MINPLALVTGGLLSAIDLPEVENVLPIDTVDGVQGTFVYDPEFIPGSSGIAYLSKSNDVSAWFRLSVDHNVGVGWIVVTDARGVRRMLSVSSGGTIRIDDFVTGRYTLYAVLMDENSQIVSVSNVLVYEHSSSVIETQDQFRIEWRTDYNDNWIGGTVDETTTRERFHVDASAHWLQWRARTVGQNQRMVIRNTAIEARMLGMSELAGEKSG